MYDTLEDILRGYFGCKRPFHKNYPENKDGFTVKGSEAYFKLTTLLEDVGSLTGHDMKAVISELDEITYWKDY